MTQLIASWTLNIKTISEANTSEHWTKKSKRHKQQKFFVRLAFNQLKKPIELPCKVIMTRLASRELDFVNLCVSLKWIQDQIADCLIPGKAAGQADSDPRITWEFKQEKRNINGVRIDLLAP